MDIELINERINFTRSFNNSVDVDYAHILNSSDGYDYISGEEYGPITDAEILLLEKRLGFKVCDDYRTFLKQWGGWDFMYFVVTGIFFYDGDLCYAVIEDSLEFFGEHFEGQFNGKTVFGYYPEKDWIYILDHSTSLVTPFDAIHSCYVEGNTTSVEDFLLFVWDENHQYHSLPEFKG